MGWKGKRLRTGHEQVFAAQGEEEEQEVDESSGEKGHARTDAGWRVEEWVPGSVSQAREQTQRLYMYSRKQRLRTGLLRGSVRSG